MVHITTSNNNSSSSNTISSNSSNNSLPRFNTTSNIPNISNKTFRIWE